MEELKAINIKGKSYIMVNERLRAFRQDYRDWSLESEIIHLDENSCVIKAIIRDENGIIKATGLAQEDKSSSMINNTSFVENCETSAWGRALGNLGIGIQDSIASAEEVSMAIAKQEYNDKREVVGGDYVMQSGKHKGEMIKNIPEDYLKWYFENGYDNFIKENIKKFLEDRPTEIEI